MTEMAPYERECNAEDDARRVADLEDELRRINSWDRGPHPLPIRLAERRAEITTALDR